MFILLYNSDSDWIMCLFCANNLHWLIEQWHLKIHGSLYKLMNCSTNSEKSTPEWTHQRTLLKHFYNRSLSSMNFQFMYNTLRGWTTSIWKQPVCLCCKLGAAIIVPLRMHFIHVLVFGQMQRKKMLPCSAQNKPVCIDFSQSNTDPHVLAPTTTWAAQSHWMCEELGGTVALLTSV